MIRTALATVAIISANVAPPLAAQDESQAPMERVEAVLEEGRAGAVKAVIVEQAGEILYERYFDGADTDDLQDMRSAGKSISALAVGMAIADGAVASTDARVLAELGAAGGRENIALEDLLTMSSALDCNDWDEDSPGQEDRMYPRRNWREHALAIPLNGDYERGRDGRGRFSYCTAGVFLTGQYLEQATGQAFDDYVETRLFAPLDIGDVAWTRSPSGEVQAGGQLSMHPIDMVRIGRLVLDEGRAGDEQLVPASWIERMLTPQVRATDSDDYGYWWWLRAFRSGTFSTSGWYALGNGGTTLVLLDELDAVVVVVAANFNQPGMHQIARDIIERGALPLLLSQGE